MRKPTYHLLGNMIKEHDVRVEGSNLILYKAVYKQNEKPKYYALFWDKVNTRPKYEIGKTYKLNHGESLGYFLGTLGHVVSAYYYFVPKRRILKCAVPISSIAIRKMDVPEARERWLDNNFTTNWIQCNKFTVLEDITDHLNKY